MTNVSKLLVQDYAFLMWTWSSSSVFYFLLMHWRVLLIR